MMPAPAPDREHFARLIETLQPWLAEIVVVGGWAHRLYRLHTLSGSPGYAPLATLDTDVAPPLELPPMEENIRERLLANDFAEELLGDFRPPVVKYHTRLDASGFYAEFLTPLEGSGEKRDGTKDATVRIAGVTAQKLRHLGILLYAPWSVTIGPETGYPTSEARSVRIPNPAAYLAQKILIHRKRSPGDKAKDILYIHDTLEAFADSLPAIQREWQTMVKPNLHERAIREIEGAADQLFGDLSDSVRAAARIPAGREVTPESLRELCHYGLKQMLR